MFQGMASPRKPRWIILGLAALGGLLAWRATRPGQGVVGPASAPPHRESARSTPIPRLAPSAAQEKHLNSNNNNTNHLSEAPDDAEDQPTPARVLSPEAAGDMVRDIMQREVAPEIMACMTEWRDEAPDARGRVTMAFTLGPEGLEDARIEDYEALPVGLLSCVSAAVWEGDWPASPEGRLEVYYPISLAMGGAEP